MSARLNRLQLLETRAMMAGLVHEDDLGYLGAFNVPQGEVGASTFEYGGTSIAYNPTNDSLYMVGHDWDQAIAEISVPELDTGAVDGLETAGVLQSLTPVLNRLPHQTLDEEGVKIGGLMVHDNRLVGTAYEYYDSDMSAFDSHFMLDSLNLDSYAIGLFQVGDMGGGYVGGYMAEVPPEWRDELGTSYITGQAGLSIISRTSAGPAAFGFDPAELSWGINPASPLLFYPLSNPLALETTQNPLFNTTTEIKGVVFPEGTDSVLFIGSHGTGPWWYGEADEGGVDPYRSEKGPHAPDYVYQVWAYDLHDLAAVKNGQFQPWEVQPYDVWDFELPYADGSGHVGGIAYDKASGRMFVSQLYGNGAYPVVHAFQVGAPTDGTPEPTTVSIASVATAIAEHTVLASDLKVADIQLQGGNATNYVLALGGADPGAFALVGSELFLRAGTLLDHEAKPAYSVTIEARDALLGTALGSPPFTLNVTNENDAPVLDAGSSPTLVPIDEDATNPQGTLVAQLVAGMVGDQDAGALSGIAVISAFNDYGEWQFSRDAGTTWQAMGAVNKASGRLLSADAATRVRFVPRVNFNGQVTLCYFAWDQTQGMAGDLFDLSGVSGRSQAFSEGLEEATQMISPVNDAPLLDATLSPKLPAIVEDATSPVGVRVNALLGTAITDIDASAVRGLAVTSAAQTHGAWQYSLNGGLTWSPFGAVTAATARLLPADGMTRVRFIPAANYYGNANIYYRAWDRSDGKAAGSTVDLSKASLSTGRSTAYSTAVEYASVTVTSVNDAPTLLLAASSYYKLNSTPVPLSSISTVTDVDTSVFNGGELRVSIGAGADASNRFQIGGPFTVVNGQVRLNGVAIGYLNASAGVGATDLAITLNGRATRSVVEQLVRSIMFRTESSVLTASRVVNFTLSDGRGGTTSQSTTVHVVAP